MLAVFERTVGWKWDSLPVHYKDSPDLNLDPTVIAATASEMCRQQVNIQLECAEENQEEDIIIENEIAAVPVISQDTNNSYEFGTYITRCTHVIKDIQNNLYGINSPECFEKILSDLEVLYNKTKEMLPLEEGLPVRQEHVPPKTKKKVRKNTLPLRKKTKVRFNLSKRLFNKKPSKTVESVIVDGTFETPTSMETSDGDINDKQSRKTKKAQQILTETETVIDSNSNENSVFRESTNKKVRMDNPVQKVQQFVTSGIQSNMSFNVIGYKINRRSFSDLDSMLPDEVMNAYISLKCKEYKDKSVHFLSCEIMTSIFCGFLNEDDPYPIHSFLEGIDIDEFDVIIGALHEGGCHWSLMVIYPKKLELVYLNPLGETRYSKDIYLQKWLYCNGIGTFISEDWCITSKRHQKQQDSNSCVLRFAELILKGVEDLRFQSTKKHLQTLRLEIGQFLVESSDIMQEVAVMQEIGPIDEMKVDNVDEADDNDYSADNDDTKISVETCQNHYETCKEKLYNITVKTVDGKFNFIHDFADHIRHHEFVANPLRVHNTERFTHGFGQNIIKMRALEYVHSKLSSDLLHFTGHDPKHPYTVRPYRTILGLKNGELETRFKAFRLAPQYITYVLLKEITVLLHIVTHESQYDITNEMCKQTEINVAKECRNMKKK